MEEPNPNQSTLKDISNFKTPKRQSHQNPNNHFHSPHSHFFTASKQTPKSATSSFTRRPRPSLASRRLKAFELEQSKSARKVQTDKENSLKSLGRSLTVWLNFLLENPRSCGCSVSKVIGDDNAVADVCPGGKRDSLSRDGVGVDQHWRQPKRMRDSSWMGMEDGVNVRGSDVLLPNSMFPRLRVSLVEVCSLDDLTERMREYLSLSSCKEIFSVMTQVTKNIDEGRVKMKAHCPLVTDVGMKERAMRILMSYNPVWLRIGLYIVFGGDSLLPDGDVSSEQEVAFLKMVIEKQFFTHAGLAKAYVYNKLVDGLYRPGYFEKLGEVILKRFLLLVIILDRAKSKSSLPINYGIDGLDGGSPLLFALQSNIKSSRQVICDFLSSEVMHGEGNLLAHLVIVGYKVFYQQSPLVEYDFKVTQLFEDLQDGVRLCRATQLLLNDSSILMKVLVPSDNRKKNMVNCGIALQRLKNAGMPLFDEDGTMIIEDDVVSGDKELTVSLLWNMFVHLQLPLLVNNMLLFEEISKIRGDKVEQLNTGSLLDMLLKWIQAICEQYDNRVDNFSSLLDGKGMWCLLDFYFRRGYHGANSNTDQNGTVREVSIMSAADYTDAVHNFILSQKLTSLLGNFPEVMQVSDILEYNGACNDRSVVILLVFLSSQLIKGNTEQLNFHKLLGFNCRGPDRKCISRERWIVNSEAEEERQGKNCEDNTGSFKAIMAWWREMAQRNSKSSLKPVYPALQNVVTARQLSDAHRENAAKMIQCYVRRLIEYNKYVRIKNAVSLLQALVRAWLIVKKKSAVIKLSTINVPEPSSGHSKLSKTYCRCMTFMLDRHSFVELKWRILIIQRAVRAWISRKRHTESQENFERDVQMKAALIIQFAWKKYFVYISHRRQHSAATKIQTSYRGWLLRKSFRNQKQAVTRIQGFYRRLKSLRRFQHHQLVIRSVICIQSLIRGWVARRVAYRQRRFIVTVQSHCRGWLTRRNLLAQKEAVIKIQGAFRCFRCWQTFNCYREAAIQVQRFVRGWITRKRLLGASYLHEGMVRGYICEDSRGCLQSLELKTHLNSVMKARTKSVVLIQSHIRGWIARRKATRQRHRVAVIQSYWKGYLARKDLRGKLAEIHLRVQKSAANVENGKRLINRLIVALSELLSMKSVSGILHTCATLDMATEYSHKCCEELVAAGAIVTLLKLICSVSRSIPDQEVLKHTLSTLRNLTRHPHLTKVLVDIQGSVRTILQEFLRNKGEGYFIAAELLQNVCSNQKGVEAIRSPVLLRRLHNHVEDLRRKAVNEKRNPRTVIAGEQTEKRLNEAAEILRMVISGCS